MTMHSLGLALELFPNQRLPRFAGRTSVSSVPVASGAFAQFPSRKLYSRPISANSLIAAFSAKCSLAPARSVSGAAEHSSPRSLRTSSIATIAPQAGKPYRTYHGHLSVGKRNFRQLLLITSSPSLEGGMGSSFACTLALPASGFEFHGRRVRSVLYRILKLSTPFNLSWSMKKRCVKLRVSRALAGGVHHMPIYKRWLSALHKYYVVTSSSGCLVEFNHIIANKMYRGFRGFHASSDGIGYLSTSRSLRAEAEGHGIPEKVMLVEEEEPNEKQLWSTGERKRDFLAVGYGWRVRDAALDNLQELMRVADIQTDAFHIPAAAFDDLFYKLFHAEVLSSLQYKARHSPPDRYSCLLAEKDPSQPGYIDDFLNDEIEQTIVGAVDVTALMDSNIVSLLPGAYEYLYISGMAVDAAYRKTDALHLFDLLDVPLARLLYKHLASRSRVVMSQVRGYKKAKRGIITDKRPPIAICRQSSQRRRSVATLLLEACVVRASGWGFKYLVLHAYEDDIAARNLYSRAGFRTVGGDPLWITKFLGRRRRVVMARHTVPVPEKYPG